MDAAPLARLARGVVERSFVRLSFGLATLIRTKDDMELNPSEDLCRRRTALGNAYEACL